MAGFIPHGASANDIEKVINKFSNKTKKLHYIVIFISICTLVGTLIFSYLDYIGDKKWQKQQQLHYQKMIEELQKSNLQNRNNNWSQCVIK